MARKTFLTVTVALASLLALMTASAAWVGVAGITGGALALAAVLHSPLGGLLGWLTFGPTVGGLVDAVFGGGIPALTPDRVLLLLVLAVSTAAWLRHPGTMLPPGRIEVAMGLFLAIAAVSALARGGAQMSQIKGSMRLDFVFLIQGYGVPFVAFTLARNLVARERQHRALLNTLVGLSTVMALVGAVQYFTGSALFFSDRYGHAGEQRAIGTLPAVVDYGMVLSSGALAAGVLLLRRPRLPKACALAGALAIIMVSVTLNKTRAVWVGVAMGFVVAFVVERRFRRMLVATAAAAAVAGLLAFPFLADSDFFKGRVMAVNPIYNRIAIYATAINMIAHRPFLGGGFGRYTFQEDKWEYLTGLGDVSSTWAVHPGVPHNEYLHVLALVGLVGFLPYAFVLGSSWRTLRRSYARFGAEGSAGADTTLVALAVLGVYLANGLFSDLMFASQTSNQVYVLLGAADGYRVRAEGDAPSPSGEDVEAIPATLAGSSGVA